MRFLLLAAILVTSAWACGGGGGDFEPPPPAPDTVYVQPQFVEAVGSDITPQLNDYDWQLEGMNDDGAGPWTLSGASVVLRLHSPLYQGLDTTFVIPDTISADENGLRRYRPVVTIQRLVPALLRAEWAADFAGPMIRIEIYAPHGLAGVRLSTDVYYQACRVTYPGCEDRITGIATGHDWSDTSAAGVQSWATITGPWYEWPSALPPGGYEGGEPAPGWHAVVGVHISDDQGHDGHGSCEPGLIPSGDRELTCNALFIK